MEELCVRYWKPVYTYVRIVWAKSNEDSKDLTQAFFAWLLEGDALRRYVPERGGFRAFLKLVLRRFLIDRDEASKRLKRGGGIRILPQPSEIGLEEIAVAGPSADPERGFDEAWAEVLVRNAVDRVRERFAAEGRSLQFQAFQEYDLAPEEAGVTYASVAERLGIRVTMVRDYIAAVREALRTEIRRELACLTMDESDMEEEWRALFGP